MNIVLNWMSEYENKSEKGDRNSRKGNCAWYWMPVLHRYTCITLFYSFTFFLYFFYHSLYLLCHLNFITFTFSLSSLGRTYVIVNYFLRIFRFERINEMNWIEYCIMNSDTLCALWIATPLFIMNSDPSEQWPSISIIIMSSDPISKLSIPTLYSNYE